MSTSTAPRLKPQTLSVLRHLESGATITDAEARTLFGIARLSARIEELRRAGYHVPGEYIQVRTRFGKTRVARYSLPK